MFGALTVAVARRAWTFVPAFMVSFTLSALYLIVPTAAFLTSQAGDDMGFQWVWFTLVGLVAGGGVAVWVRRQRVPLTKHAIRRKGPLVVLTCASLLVAAADPV